MKKSDWVTQRTFTPYVTDDVVWRTRHESDGLSDRWEISINRSLG